MLSRTGLGALHRGPGIAELGDLGIVAGPQVQQGITHRAAQPGQSAEHRWGQLDGEQSNHYVDECIEDPHEGRVQHGSETRAPPVEVGETAALRLEDLVEQGGNGAYHRPCAQTCPGHGERPCEGGSDEAHEHPQDIEP